MFGSQRVGQESHTRGSTSWPVQLNHISEFDWVIAGYEHYWKRRRRGPRRYDRSIPTAYDQADVMSNEVIARSRS